MAGDEERFELCENPKFNRSLTIRSTSIELQKKPHLQNPFERKGSFVKLYNSSFESVVSAGYSIKGKVEKLCSLFERTKSPTSVLDESQPQSKSSKLLGLVDDSSIRLVDTEDRIVVYFTSLRGIRRTYEDCCSVRMILRGFRVKVDERDISMDLAYKKELQSVLGEKNVNLPQVFIRGEYIGGADVIKQLHEVGELGKMIKGIPIRVPGYVCEGCGDVRFVPCSNCNGSRKVYNEDEDQLNRCSECNENGLVRCPACCS
ncbi:Thioredoxin-like fold protein [Actinidia chinensis var. chinensis]|uniref:Thioredoxin-like fold protein n=1 Tax=Actinidia chinensis var. chinensis TaxID=1590841 RepID=A0A2R6RD49_ACTCC|nr:Thioredoxin-like fold protein [Actinidia chinensis var. chinensis]